MMMVFCRGCGKEIHETAPICPHCGAPQGGHNESDAIPDGIKGWSWGAFLLNWIWAIGNNTLIGLLALIPIVGFVMAVVLGFKGREWAWRNRKWDSIEHFNRVQERWSFWGVMLTFVPVILAVIGIILAIAIPAYSDYQHRARKEADKKQIGIERQVDNPNSSIPSQPSIATEKQITPEEAAIAQAEDLKVVQQRSDRIKQLYEAKNYAGVIAEAKSGEYMANEHNLLGLAFYATNQFSDAIRVFKESERSFPSESEIKINLGDAFFSNGQPVDALGKYREAIVLSPNNESCKQRIKQAQQAINNLRQTMQRKNTGAVVNAPVNEIQKINTVQASIEPARNDARDNAVALPLEEVKPIKIIPKTKYPTFIMAIANKDAVDVELFLQSGIDPNNKISGTLPIACAAEAGSLEVIKVLVKYGANPSYIDDHGRSPLFYAGINGKKEIAQYLKSIGAK